MKEKVTYHKDPTRIVYDQEQWALLRALREEALEIQRCIPVPSSVYGSVARGDVHPGSDIDIILFEHVPSFLLELNLDYLRREIVQATPNALIKAHIHISDRITLTMPLVNMNEQEQDFYRYSGCIETERLGQRKDRHGHGERDDTTGDADSDSGTNLERFDRVAGVSKRLILVEPTDEGHRERSMLDDPYVCRRLLGVAPDIIEERIRVLTRRDKVGRTGVFLRTDVLEDESIEERLQAVADRNNIVRRMLKRRGWL